MRPAHEIIAAMQSVAPPGQLRLDPALAGLLTGLTYGLMEARQGYSGEYARFLGIARRGLPLPEDELCERIRHADVMVIGGTGCIGSKLIEHLTARRSGLGCLRSVSRGITDRYPRHADVRYLHADIRNREDMDTLMGKYRPDLVFLTAAQRDPGLAETEVHRTVTTNVLGAFNVLAAAAEHGIPQVVMASTGKALRPYSPDMYTASKRAAEWVAAQIAADSGMLVSAGRFTHVLDNSIIYRRLQHWAQGAGPVRLHSPDIAFYVQSARESAHLLLLAALGARRDEFRISAISDLGWPVSLLDLALGVLAENRTGPPIYFSGYDKGYEEIPFPGLYDPMTAGEVSPLLNAFETAALTDTPSPRVDTFRMPASVTDDRRPWKALASLSAVCDATKDPDVIRAAMDEMSWAVLDATLQEVPRPVLARTAAITRRHEATLSTLHWRVLEAIEQAADPG